MHRSLLPATLIILLVGLGFRTIPAESATLRDGKRFDPAATWTERAPRAPAELDHVGSLVGAWDVLFTSHPTDSTTFQGTGRAVITYMNRGHALMERFHTPTVDAAGEEGNTLSFLVYNPAASTWLLGMADSYTEHITVYDGNHTEDGLVLGHAERHRGGARIIDSRLTLDLEEDDAFRMQLESSADRGDSWAPTWTRRYARSSIGDDGFPTEGHGRPAPDRPEEAAAFDFLIGEWDEQHDLEFPGRPPASFPAHGSAVHVLNGRAILEFGWYDVDPTLPDAAASIVRIWNRQMRRWECMYSTNRFNGILLFGGVQEDDRIVLHQFDAHLGDSPVNYWIFHDMARDSYLWHAESSQDRGRSFQTTWRIAGTRKTP